MIERKDARHKYGSYMRVTDNFTHELLGYLSDISLGGFRLETPKPLKVGNFSSIRLEYTSGVIDKPYVVLVAQAKWIDPDPITPDEYIEGFQIVSMSPSEQEMYRSVVENYGPPARNW
jgi:hypothetical protein